MILLSIILDPLHTLLLVTITIFLLVVYGDKELDQVTLNFMMSEIWLLSLAYLNYPRV